MLAVDKSLSTRKTDLLAYFRERAAESLEEVRRTYAATEFKAQTLAIHKAMVETKGNIVKALLQKAAQEEWTNEEILRCILLVTYATYVVMIEARNEIWPYDYMTFSRRVGELWEPFAKLSFHYPLKDLTFFVPPLFAEVKRRLTQEIEDYIDTLTIVTEQKDELKQHYEKVWGFVTSGEIKLELDLHFEQAGEKVVADFKSGFGSNEKGNTNRLLLVATIYKNLDENYKCLLLVRSEEDGNNNYFKTLKNSGVWEASCGAETDEKIREYTGFNLREWIQTNIDWANDFRPMTIQHLTEKKLDSYLKW